MKSALSASLAAALVVASGTAIAQSNQSDTDTPPSRQQERLNSIFGTLLGDRTGSPGSLEAQWALGRTPLATQRAQFETRVDSDMRSGALDRRTGMQLKTDYYDLVQLEARYGADRRFTTQERADLADRYGNLTQVMVDGGNAGPDRGNSTATVAEGQAEFNQRVDAALAARRITRVASTRLKTDYSALIRTEASYLRDGVITAQEQDDLDSQLDALDMRVGDTAYSGGAVAQSPRMRLDAIARALPASGLTAASQAQLRTEHEDLSRLESAYARINATADDRAYMDRRLSELETRARVRR